MLYTSFTGEGKLNSVASNATECVNDDIALTPTGNMSSNSFRCHWEPSLCTTHHISYYTNSDWCWGH